ncbi:CrcB family protein [Roseomonas terrae]|uniref:Fluoride-specific ion channel FluC n=1 Tax=Neoroseomonas terrae TaxID=424799 RepID=A0ABS5EC44_9PROT|nr:CrcB family protein [Neoroseomonas terrae]MBR0648589.1 CrcB family protein [Neoroseomonas terrae]
MRGIDFLWVGLGGGLGSLLRWQAGKLVGRRFSLPSWAATLVINVTGAFVIAYISALLAMGWEERYGSFVASFVLTGIIGGYTTFSTMQLDALEMAGGRPSILPAAYLLGSAAAGLAAAAAGVALARW